MTSVSYLDAIICKDWRNEYMNYDRLHFVCEEYETALRHRSMLTDAEWRSRKTEQSQILVCYAYVMIAVHHQCQFLAKAPASEPISSILARCDADLRRILDFLSLETTRIDAFYLNQVRHRRSETRLRSNHYRRQFVCNFTRS
jgi:hypothetical protein